jgi:enamine deaminase RidA (YjgF/YER057c/UK114 family)
MVVLLAFGAAAPGGSVDSLPPGHASGQARARRTSNGCDAPGERTAGVGRTWAPPDGTLRRRPGPSILFAMERRVINPWTWQDAFGFVQANEVSGAKRTVICSGQTSVDADGAPQHAGDMAAQIRQALANLETVLQHAGLQLSDVVRLNYYTTDVDRFVEAAPAGLHRLAEAGCRPASTLLGVARLFHPAILVEIEATAMV